MSEFQYITLRERPELKDEAAEWFHKNWGVPKDAYLECMDAYLDRETEACPGMCRRIAKPSTAGTSAYTKDRLSAAWA